MANSGIFSKFVLGDSGLDLMKGEIVMTGIVFGIKGSKANRLPTVHQFNDYYNQS
jgi:hypothetical protein